MDQRRSVDFIERALSLKKDNELYFELGCMVVFDVDLFGNLLSNKPMFLFPEYEDFVSVLGNENVAFNASLLYTDKVCYGLPDYPFYVDPHSKSIVYVGYDPYLDDLTGDMGADTNLIKLSKKLAQPNFDIFCLGFIKPFPKDYVYTPDEKDFDHFYVFEGGKFRFLPEGCDFSNTQSLPTLYPKTEEELNKLLEDHELGIEKFAEGNVRSLGINLDTSDLVSEVGKLLAMGYSEYTVGWDYHVWGAVMYYIYIDERGRPVTASDNYNRIIKMMYVEGFEGYSLKTYNGNYSSESLVGSYTPISWVER